MNKRKLIASIIFLLLFLLIYIYKNQFHFELYQDELHYYPTAIQFSKEPLPSIHLLETFNELNTPLPFIIGGWVLNIFGESIVYLRLLNFFLSFVIISLFIWLSPASSPRFWLCLLGLAIFPNYYLCSVHYYTDIISLLAVLLGVIGYLYKAHVLSCLAFIAAIASRQYMLAFPAAIILHEVYRMFQASNYNLGITLKSALQTPSLYLYALACLSLLPWILLWGGPAPAAEMLRQDYDKAVVYNGGFLLYASAVLAVYYILLETVFTNSWSYYITYPRRHPLLFGSFVVVVLVLAIFFPAKQTYNSYFTWPYLGYFDNLLTLIGIKGLPKQLLFASLMLVTLMRFITPAMSLSGWIVLINLILLGKAQLSWDKYSLPTIMVLWFLTLFDEFWSLHHERPQEQVPLASESRIKTL
ncbi:hypothetical protein [Telluribacter sp. SYSU D00476]|uniref:hypothetical protein n=1 Tax=Telluribacter sp. SYSU D00476 TaxID=2811430 RepID=UPI001FF3BBF2|nr:hypothetical protein [Telluribacter sp. SYSU D00476]